VVDQFLDRRHDRFVRDLAAQMQEMFGPKAAPLFGPR
jgi:hypothetical protein